MANLAFRLGVLLLALLLQAGSWRAEATSASVVASPPASMGDFDATDDLSEELPGVDDSSGTDIVAGAVQHWCSAASSDQWHAWADGLPPGGPPLDAPFKPPRS